MAKTDVTEKAAGSTKSTRKKASSKPDAKSKAATATATAKKPAARKAPAKTKPAAKKQPAARKAEKQVAAPAKRTGKRYWLFKSEPFKYAFDDLKAEGPEGGEWDGIRNYQARNFMREMKVGDLAFFYHSNEGLAIVGICEVSAQIHPDSTTDDERWECVDVRYVCDLPEPVTLKAVKANPKLAEMSLVTSMRLSVQPVTADEWKEVLKMAGLSQKAIDAARNAARNVARKK